MIVWGRVGVPAVLTLAFAVPLTVIMKNRTIREEPMVMLVLNMTVILFAFNALFFVTSVSDWLTGNDTPALMCSLLMSAGLGIFGGFKLSTLFLATEQFIAVVFSLRHYTIMSKWVNRMIIFTWLFVLVFVLFCLTTDLLGLETIAEFDIRVFGVDHQISTCGWQKVSSVFMLVFQIVFSLFSIVTCSLLIYTAVEGMKHEKRITHLVLNPPDRYLSLLHGF